MQSVNHNQLERMLVQGYNKKMSCYIWGAPGIGKSDTVRKVTKELALQKNKNYNEDILKINDENNFSIIDIRISQLDPSDLRGLPKLDNGSTKWLPPSWLPRTGNGIIFFDELNTSPPSIQSACYQLILDRKLGDYVLPEGWSIISAGNRESDMANVFDMSAPLLNRFLHFELSVPRIEEWQKWAIENNVNTNIITFLMFKPSSIFVFDENLKDKSFPTPRSWYFCSKIIEGLDIKDEDFVEALISSAVGQAIAVEFLAFLKLQSKLDLNKILSHPEAVEKITEKNLRFVLVGALSDKYKNDREKFDKILAVCQYLEAEFALLLIRFLKTVDVKDFSSRIRKSDLWMTELKEKYKNYLL